MNKKLRWFSKPDSAHLVQFYSDETALLQPLFEYIRTGLVHGHTCVVIATRNHVAELNKMLINDNMNIKRLQDNGQYLTFDAAETLSKFMVNGLPDQKLFSETVGSVIERAIEKGAAVRAYGEMVAVLWKAGNKEGVIQLENIWNELGDKHSFSLYCAYPELHFLSYGNDLSKISNCHTITV